MRIDPQDGNGSDSFNSDCYSAASGERRSTHHNHIGTARVAESRVVAQGSENLQINPWFNRQDPAGVQVRRGKCRRLAATHNSLIVLECCVAGPLGWHIVGQKYCRHMVASRPRSKLAKTKAIG